MITSESLKQYVANNPRNVTVRESTQHPGLYVLKYKKHVFYNDSWDPFLEVCRGIIVDADFNVVSMPFDKIYNFGIESRAPAISPDTPITAFRKVNGFMASMTHDDRYGVLVSTTGSLDSDYVDMVRQLMLPNLAQYQQTLQACRNYTFMFEVCHPNDPHIIPEAPGLYLLAAREKHYGSAIDYSYSQTSIFPSLPVQQLRTTMGAIVELAKTVRHEGFVVYADDGRVTKCKSSFYLVNKWVARNPNTRKIVDLNNDMKKTIDEEYHGLIDHIRANINEYTALGEQQCLVWIRAFFDVV